MCNQSCAQIWSEACARSHNQIQASYCLSNYSLWQPGCISSCQDTCGLTLNLTYNSTNSQTCVSDQCDLACTNSCTETCNSQTNFIDISKPNGCLASCTKPCLGSCNTYECLNLTKYYDEQFIDINDPKFKDKFIAKVTKTEVLAYNLAKNYDTLEKWSLIGTN